MYLQVVTIIMQVGAIIADLKANSPSQTNNKEKIMSNIALAVLIFTMIIFLVNRW